MNSEGVYSFTGAGGGFSPARKHRAPDQKQPASQWVASVRDNDRQRHCTTTSVSISIIHEKH